MPVLADRNRIRQVLINLIDNAIKYGRECDGHVLVSLTPGRNGIRIAVRDTRDYERLLREKLYKIPGIRHSKSHFVLRVLKEATVPL